MKQYGLDSPGESMTTRLSDDRLDKMLKGLFPVDEGLPCPKGTALLRTFAEARTADFGFLEANDLVGLRSSAFAGIPEWEAFSRHYGSCGLCNA
jgi:hypothetical protein